MKINSVIISLIAIAIVLILIMRNSGQSLRQIFTQSEPVNLSYNNDGYSFGELTIPELKMPTLNGVSIPPPSSQSTNKSGCCCSGGKSMDQVSYKPPTLNFNVNVSPSQVAPPTPLTPPPKMVSYQAPQEPDYAAYLRMYPDLMEFVQGNHLKQPHWTRGQGLREADYNRDGRVQELEFSRWHAENFAELEGREVPMKNAGSNTPLIPYM